MTDEPLLTTERREDVRYGERVAERDAITAESLRRSAWALWLGFLIPPAMALGNLEFGFVLAHIACATRTRVYIHIFMFSSLLIVLIAGWIARREWIALGEATPGELSGPLGSRRFLALAGMIGSAISALLVIAQWFPTFVIGPCMRT